MKKNGVLIGIIAFLLVIIIIGAFYISLNNKKENTLSQIDLGSTQYVDSLQRIRISNTEDFFIITQNIKWNIPSSENGETVSLAVAIPYTFIVDGKDYKGIYQLNNTSGNVDDNNPKYKLTIDDLTKDGAVKITISKKTETTEVGSFNQANFTIDDYTINLNSAEKGSPESDSYFTTNITIISNDQTESEYYIRFLDIIDSNTIPYDSNFNVYEEDTISINGKEYKYYINRSGWNAILCYTIPNENKKLVIKINGSDVFSADGVQLKHLATIDKEMLNSKELAGVLNYTITK